MSIQIPESWRIKLGTKYLDFVEKLPQFGGGRIAQLQELRQFQRREAEEAFNGSRPPDGATLEVRTLRLIELFHLEDFDQLRTGLNQLFPEFENKFGISNVSETITAFTDEIGPGGRAEVGTIRRGGKDAWFSVGLCCNMAELPVEVSYISLAIHKFLSSSVILTFDVHLTEIARQQVAELQNKYYLPVVKFRGLLPFGKGFLHSVASPFSGASDQMELWQDDLRRRIEGCVSPYLKGYFLGEDATDTATLPAIEIFVLRGAPTVKKEFQEWRERGRRWWEWLGFRFSFDTYESERALFVWADKDSLRQAPHRLVIVADPLSKEDNVDYRPRFVLRGLAAGIAVWELLNLMEDRVARLRKDVFVKRGVWGAPHRHVPISLQLSHQLRRESMLLDRVLNDFEQGASWIKILLAKDAGLEKMFAVLGKNPEPLSNTILFSIRTRAERLRKHVGIINSYFADYLTGKNMEITFLLQRRMLWLAIIATAATVLSALPYWHTIQEWSKKLLP